MSVSTRPLGGSGMRNRRHPTLYSREARIYDPSDFALKLDSSYLDQAATGSFRRPDERPSRAAKTRKPQEIQLVVARSRGKQPGWGGRGGIPRLLARQDELAHRRPGIFIPGLPELRRQAAVRRENLQRVWPLPL